jgi:hypothetical protein
LIEEEKEKAEKKSFKYRTTNGSETTKEYTPMRGIEPRA